MKKLLIASVIVFSMIFTAGLASAVPPANSITTTSGNLWFVDSATGTVTEVTGAVLTLTPVSVPSPNTAGQPADIWTGTLTFPADTPLGTSAVTVDISAFRGPEDPHLFHNIHGTDGASLLLSAEGATNDRAWSSTTPKKWKLGFGIRGTVNDPGTFIGNFEGVLFY